MTRSRRSRDLSSCREGLMTERVGTAEVRPLLTEIVTETEPVRTGTGTEQLQIGTALRQTGTALLQMGTVTGSAQTLLVTVAVLGIMGDTRRSPTVNLMFGNFVSVTSSGS